MSLISLEFGFFLIPLILIYYSIPKRHQWKILLIGSYMFYAFSGINNFIYIITTTVSTFFAALIIHGLEIKSKDLKKDFESKIKKKVIDKAYNKRKKCVLIIGLIINIGMLVFFKYFNFIALSLDLPTIELGFLLPLGISFYIFQSLGYLLDVYHKRYKPERNIFKYALFVSYFPQLVQGPIGRFPKLASQLFKGHELNYDNIKYGIQLAMWGLFKKLIISDRIGDIVNGVFADYELYPGSFVFFALICYGIQIYCDFSGGIDIARGISEMLGIKMSINFRQPFFARSLADFWRRWHITLGSWLKDYLFFPLNLSKPLVALNKLGRKVLGSQKGKFISLSISTFIIYFIVGIWHGAGMKYIAFGIWNGSIITLSLLLEQKFLKTKRFLHIGDSNFLFTIFTIIRTNILVSLGRYFTRAENFQKAMEMLKHTFTDFNLNDLTIDLFYTFSLMQKDYIILILALIILFIVDFYGEQGIDLRKTLENKSGALQLATMVMTIFVIIYFGIFSKGYISTEFIYKQF